MEKGTSFEELSPSDGLRTSLWGVFFIADSCRRAQSTASGADPWKGGSELHKGKSEQASNQHSSLVSASVPAFGSCPGSSQ